ncbi:MAG: hypothetical protein IPP42_02555 [Saprospiraceae bacterium]|nr:hypothetical protein [Saprospiraceae bacterium]
MKELKFLRVLSQLSKPELQKFKKFLDSPYCNSNPILSLLFSAVVSVETGSVNESVDKSNVWKQLYAEKEFNDPKWRKTCNDLLTALQKFFTFEQIDHNELLEENLLLEYLYEHKLESMYKSVAQSAQSSFERNKNLSSEYHLQRFQLERNLYDLLEYDINMESQSNQETIHHYLDLFYISEKTKQLVNAATRRHDFNLPIFIKLEEEVIDIIEKNNFQQYPEIDIYYRIYQLKRNANTEAGYKELKLKLYENILKFPLDDAVDIFKEIINYCIFQYNQGLNLFVREALEWYKYGLKFDLTFPQDKFHPGHFLNIVLFGIRTKEFTWTENFIEEYQKIIPPDQKHTLVTFSLARLYFNQKKFDQVIEKLRDVEFDELTYNLDSKVLLLATYFEVEEWPALVSLADSFRTFLNRHEKDITAAKKLRYSNFIKFVKRLSKVKYQDQAAKTKVIADIKSTEGVVNQGWLIEKAMAV